MQYQSFSLIVKRATIDTKYNIIMINWLYDAYNVSKTRNELISKITAVVSLLYQIL